MAEQRGGRVDRLDSSKKRLLVIDDETDRRDTLGTHLEREMQATTVEGVSSTAVSESQRTLTAYDAIIVRHELQSESGIELLERFRDDYGQRVRVFLVVSPARAVSEQEVARVGARRVLEQQGRTAAHYRVLAQTISDRMQTDIDDAIPESDVALSERLLDSDEAILLMEGDRFVDGNEAAARMLGYESRAPLQGTHPAEISPPTQPDGRSSAAKVNAMVRMGYEGGYHRFEWVHRRADGEDLPVIVSLTPIVYEDTRMLYCVWREPSEASVPGGEDGYVTVGSPLSETVVRRDDTIRALVLRTTERADDAVTTLDEADGIEATAVPSANEALLTLTSRDDIDALVTTLDSERRGLELVEQVRAEYPALPSLLVPASGSDITDARAMVDELLAETVTTGTTEVVAVDRVPRRLRTLITKQRQRDERDSVRDRYQHLSEFLPDATAFVRDDQLLFCNEAFETVVGRESGSCVGESFVTELVAAGDADRVRNLLAGWQQGQHEGEVHSARLRRPNGSTRHCEISGRLIDTGGLSGVVVTVRDVTDRKRREQTLELERALYGTIPRRVADARTRSMLEQGVTEELSLQGYSLAWIGAEREGHLVPRAVSGETAFLSGLDLSLRNRSGETEPAIRAATTGQTQHVRDIETLFSTEWRDAALAHDYRSGFAVPLSYRGVSYGVLTVYSDEAGRFDERERRLLERFADGLAFALRSLDVENALTTGEATEMLVETAGEGYSLADLGRAGHFETCDDVVVLGSVPRDDGGTIQYLTVTGGDPAAVREAIDGHAAVAGVAIVDEGTTTRLEVETTARVPERLLAARGAVVHTTTIDSEGATIRADLPVTDDPRAVAEHLEESFGVTTLHSPHGDAPAAESLVGGHGLRGADLTAKQRAALEVAHRQGYFERPRRTTATELAETLDISHSTFLQHLHRAQEKIFERFLG